MIIFAQASLLVFIGFLFFLGGTCFLGLLSFIFSFTKVRHRWMTLACAVPAFILGLALTVTHGAPQPGEFLFAYILSWSNLLFGVLGIVSFIIQRRRR